MDATTKSAMINVNAKKTMYWVISSQASNGSLLSRKVQRLGDVALSHERPTVEATDDIVSSSIERRRIWIKSQIRKTTRRVTFVKKIFGHQSQGLVAGSFGALCSEGANMRSLCSNGVKYEDIARKFDVSESQVGLIARGESWKHIAA